MTQKPKDSIDDVLSFSVEGIDLDTMREQARMEAARVWTVPTSRVKVHLQNVHIASRDPFPTDLSTYAAVNTLGAHARCTRQEDSEMPDHDRL